MKRILIALLFSAICTNAFANHFTGAHLRYEHIAGNSYLVEISLFKTCESSAIDLPSFTKTKVKSVLLNAEILKNLPLRKLDTLNNYCPGTTNSCSNITSPYPGYIVGVYSDTVVLPGPSSDWLFILSNSNRNPGISNISSSGSQSFYIETTLNTNVGAANKTAQLMLPPPNVIFVNDTSKIPLTAIDADGHNITYTITNPVFDHKKNINYYPGFSSTQVFGAGGLSYIDANNNLILKSTTAGKYTIAILIKEFSGTRLVSESILDFVVICTNAPIGNGLSIPEPVNAPTEIRTCPGKSNVVKFDFADPNPTDNVSMTIEPPNFSGWTFNTNTNNGTGNATGTLNWQTPKTVDPNALKFFYVKVNVQDDACKQIGRATYIYKVDVESCLADSVWPGDANSDKVADMYDALAVAMNYGDTGIQRINASNNWVGQSCDFWDGSFLNNVDKKHADCNGDGKIDTADLNIIKLNYSKTHAKRGRGKTTGAYDLAFDHNGIAPNPDSNVSIKILTKGTISKLYGLSANININGITLSNPATISYNTSWLGNSTNTLSFEQHINNNNLDWTYARTDKQNQSGQGQLATINFKIPANAVDGQMVILSYDKAKLIDKEGNEFTDFEMIADTFYVQKPSSVLTSNNHLNQIKIYPNPSRDNFAIDIKTNKQQTITIKIKDISGKTIYYNKSDITKGNSKIVVDATTIHSGIYFVEVNSEQTRRTLKWVKL